MRARSIIHTHKQALREGFRDGIPIGLGYFVVAFSLGIAARNAGLTPVEGFVASLLNNASAGEYAGFTLMAAQASYLELAIVTLIANARYLLMSTALSLPLPDARLMYVLILAGYSEYSHLLA